MNKFFIKATEKACSFDEHIAAPYLRRGFELDFVPKKAEISICGLGFYRLYINGQEITKGHIAPYISNPDEICYYDTYDICSLLEEGKNTIGIILGNGFFNQFGGREWDFDKAPWIGAPRVALELSAVGDDKEIKIIADEKFKTHPSPIIFDDLRMGEHYDARCIISGWNLPGFDDSQWSCAIKAEAPRGEMKLCTADSIRVVRELKPVSIQKKKDGYLYDFGENTAGLCRLSIKGECGQKVTMWHCEILKDGEFFNDNIIFPRPYYFEYNQKDVYILNGEGVEEYVPSFTYHGFRYVLVQGVTEEQATEDLLTYLVMNSDLKHIGGFECSDEVANTLFSVVKRSDLSNFYYFPTDCPHREKNGWTGDAALSAAHMVLLYDVEASWREWLFNIRKSQNDKGVLPGIVPTAGACYDDWNGPAWDTVLFNLPYELFKKRGSTEVIKENAHAMVSSLNYFMTLRKENGTIEKGLGDWVPTGRVHPGDYITPLDVTVSILIMDMAHKAWEMFEAVGYSNEAAYAKSIYMDMRHTIRRELVDLDTMTVSGICQGSQAMALYYGVFEEDEKEKAFSVLLDIIHNDNDNFNCGVFALCVLFHVLSEFGEAELAYNMITKPQYPSYGYLLEIGATTLPEHFKIYEPYESENLCSFNHHFMGDIANWFMSSIAGLNIIDCETVEIKPNFIKKLNFASAYYDLPKGRVSVSWKRVDDTIELKVTSPVEYSVSVPENIKERVILK